MNKLQLIAIGFYVAFVLFLIYEEYERGQRERKLYKKTCGFLAEMEIQFCNREAIIVDSPSAPKPKTVTRKRGKK